MIAGDLMRALLAWTLDVDVFLDFLFYTFKSFKLSVLFAIKLN